MNPAFTQQPVSFTRESDFRQERDFSQKITATFDFIRLHWRPLGRILLVLVVPVALLRGILTGLLQSEMFGVLRNHPASSGGMGSRQLAVYSTMLSSPLYYVSSVLSIAFNAVLVLCIYGYIRECVYPTVPGTPISVGAVGNLVKRRFVGTFFSFYGVTLLVVLATILLLIPGIYVGVVLSLFFVVSVLEESGFATTLSRCFGLIKGKWWSTAGLIFVMALLLYFIMFGITIAGGLLLALTKGTIPFLAFTSSVFTIVITALTSLLTLLLYPPLLIALAFQYFNLVERQEGVGMYHLVNQLGQAPPSVPTTESYRPAEESEY